MTKVGEKTRFQHLCWDRAGIVTILYRPCMQLSLTQTVSVGMVHVNYARQSLFHRNIWDKTKSHTGLSTEKNNVVRKQQSRCHIQEHRCKQLWHNSEGKAYPLSTRPMKGTTDWKDADPRQDSPSQSMATWRSCRHASRLVECLCRWPWDFGARWTPPIQSL